MNAAIAGRIAGVVLSALTLTGCVIHAEVTRYDPGTVHVPPAQGFTPVPCHTTTYEDGSTETLCADGTRTFTTVPW